MKRVEAVALLSAGLLMLVAGMVWLLGPWGLIGSGAALVALVLFGVDVRENRGEAVEPATRAGSVPVPGRRL